MTISIDDKEKDAHAYVCAMNNLRFYFMPTMQENISMLTIKHKDGSDINNATGYYVGRMVKEKMEIDERIGEIEEMKKVNHV